MLAGPAGSRAWKRARRKVAKVAESISEVVDAAAAAVALPTLAPLSSEAAQAFARVSGQGPSSWDAMATEADRLRDSGSSAASALAAFLELDGSRLPSPDGGSFFTSPHQFPASHALQMEDKPPGTPGLSVDSQADEAGSGAWGEATRMALPVLGLAAATVVGTLFTRRAGVPRMLPRMAMRALAYPALFLQTGILASEQGAERARQAALWSLPPALLVSSCFMGWRVAAASAAAFLTAQLVNVNVSERLPRASHWWQVVLVAAAAASVVDALVFARISSRAVHGLALAMALTGDFGEVGERRRFSGVRPALKKQSAMIEMEGEVQKALPNAMFQVALDNGCQVLAHISGKIRRNRIEIFQGDRVKVEISPYDLTRGRITHRNRRAGQGPATPGGPNPPGGNPVPA